MLLGMIDFNAYNLQWKWNSGYLFLKRGWTTLSNIMIQFNECLVWNTLSSSWLNKFCIKDLLYPMHALLLHEIKSNKKKYMLFKTNVQPISVFNLTIIKFWYLTLYFLKNILMIPYNLSLIYLIVFNEFFYYFCMQKNC